LEGRADFSDGGECGFVGAGEATEGETFSGRIVHLDLTVLNSRWYETGGDGRIAGSITEVLPRDGEVE